MSEPAQGDLFGGGRGRVMLHMAETAQRFDGRFAWFCRCGASETGFQHRSVARLAGDAHLTVANSSYPAAESDSAPTDNAPYRPSRDSS